MHAQIAYTHHTTHRVTARLQHHAQLHEVVVMVRAHVVNAELDLDVSMCAAGAVCVCACVCNYACASV